MKIYSTEHALTRGIVEFDAIVDDDGNAWYQLPGDAGKGTRRMIRCVHVFTERPYAVNRAELMRNRKVESLRQQIARLSNLSFEDKP